MHDAVTDATMNASAAAAATNSSLGLPAYYSLQYRIIGFVVVTAIFIIGIIGNAMVVTVVCRTRSMHTPTNCYLVSLACADVILLVTAPLPTIVQYFLVIDDLPLGSVGCPIVIFAQYLGVNVSALSMAAFTIERYFAVCRPMRAHAVCTVWRHHSLSIPMRSPFRL